MVQISTPLILSEIYFDIGTNIPCNSKFPTLLDSDFPYSDMSKQVHRSYGTSNYIRSSILIIDNWSQLKIHQVPSKIIDHQMSLVMRKPAFSMCESKGADQSGLCRPGQKLLLQILQ